MAAGGPVLVTGGAGFIGVNLADRLARAGRRVVVLDNLSRPGSERNLAFLREHHPGRVAFVEGDVRDREAVDSVVAGASAVVHLAAQVAVTTSLADPLTDFAVNAGGTLTVLEAVRRLAPEATVVHASTNKVYGALEDLGLRLAGRRWAPAAGTGVGEDRPLDFHSPYGCSKGAADQYVRDYARSYGLRTVVLRQSCVYGPHQHGSEDQGWVAHFVHALLGGRPVTIFGDGFQVRDLLEVGDLCDLYLGILDDPEPAAGGIFNVGGGPANARSVIEVIEDLGRMLEREVEPARGPARAGDQRYYVSDLGLARERLGWEPRVGVEAGLERLLAWASGRAGW